jgi:hypothetical protein
MADMAELLRQLLVSANGAGYDAANAALRARAAEQYADCDDVDALRKQHRRALARSTDVARNDRDTCGDGDQSPVVADMPGSPGQDLIDAWSRGCDFDPQNPDMAAGMSPLLIAAFFGNAPVVEAALQQARSAGGDALRTALETRETLLRFTPLFACISCARVAARGGDAALRRGDHARVAKALLDAGANANARDVAGYTPLMHVCFNSSTIGVARTMMPLLLAAGADVNARNRAGRTALMEPTMGRRDDVLRLLMDAGADPRVKDNSGYAPTAVTRGNPTAAAAFAAYLSRAKRGPTAEAPVLDAGAGALTGRRVRLTGLTGRPELNGRTGTAVEWVAATERYAVRLEGPGEEVVRARVANVETDAELSGACAGCGAAKGARHRCAACRAVVYCSKACQKAHWKEHRGPCAAAAAACVAVVPPRAPGGVLLQPGAPAGASTPPPPPDKAFIVKVQVPMTVLMREPGAAEAARVLGAAAPDLRGMPEELMIYNETRSVLASLPPGGAAYDGLCAAVLVHGVGRAKAYLRATRDADGTLRIAYGEVLPEQPW